MAYAEKRTFYEALPVCLKVPIGWIPFSVLAGEPYRHTRRRGVWLDRASRNELRRYQEEQLRAVLSFVTAEVPAYQGLRHTVSRFSPLDALKEFPLLSKELLQGSMPDYLPRSFDLIPHYECTTGGTSGNQLRFYLDDASQSVEMGFMHRQWARVGYSPRCRKATFRGVSFKGLKRDVYWQQNPIYNELQFSPFHMNEATLGSYVEQLLRYRPEFLHGYPSALSILAEFVARNSVSLANLQLKAVLVGSEALDPGQRELMERAFNARVFSWYGHSERVILGGECEVDTAYHHFPDYGILELIRKDGSRIENPGETGELVGTSLLNRSMPLIRYRTGDTARFLEAGCGCGRFFDRFDQVEGRWEQEYVLGRGGSRISLAALNMHGPLFARVRRYQYFQSAPGNLELRVMVAPGFESHDADALRVAYEEKVAPELSVRVQIVDDIPLTERGKLRRLVKTPHQTNQPKEVQ